jgi:hypothetical protein
LKLGGNLSDKQLYQITKSIEQGQEKTILSLSVRFRGTSKNDTVSALYRQNSNEQWRLVRITDIVHNSITPEWLDAYEVPYQFGKKVKYRILIIDELDLDKDETLSHKNALGYLDFDLD